MKSFRNHSVIHPNFKLNGRSFSSSDALKSFAKELTEQEGEDRFIGMFILEWMNNDDFILVQTSGSTGIPKQIKLKKEQVRNSAEATIGYFKLVPNTKALLCLSSQYIAGKMMLVRAMVGGWDLYTVEPEKNPLKNTSIQFDFTAMVPFQVFHSIADLHKVGKIIIGGGAIPQNLEKRLQQEETLAYATYGMTETISHIAIRQVNGQDRSSTFKALPEVSFSQTSEGCLKIDAPRISDEIQVTNDVVHLLSPSEFQFLGRIDNVINTGGVKIYPEEVERKLSAHIEKPFFIASETDDALGHKIILIVENNSPISIDDLSETFKVLSTYERPKKVYSLPQFIYTDTEKIKRADVLALLEIDI